MQILLVLCLCMVGGFARADGNIFCCRDKAGIMGFQDRACAISHTPCVLSDRHYPLTSSVALADSALETDPIRALEQAKKKAIAYKKEQAKQKKQEREQLQKTRKSKQAEQALMRIERRQLRCQKTVEKIKNIEMRLRQRCKMVQMLRLKEQLKNSQTLKDRYCSVRKP